MGEQEWVVDGVAQFLRSPLWTTPVHDFIDENCILFTGTTTAEGGPTGEQPLEHTVVHNKFRELVDGLLTGYIDELGVPAEEVLAACEQSSNPDGARFIEYVYALDKYETFALLMARRNAELEAETMRQLNSMSQSALHGSATAEGAEEKGAAPEGGDASPGAVLDDDEDEDLKAAIAASLQDADASRQRQAELEDEELQRALQLSLAMEEQRRTRELDRAREAAEKQREEEERQAQAVAAAQAMAQAAEEEAKAKAEREAKHAAELKAREEAIQRESEERKAAIHSTVHEARVENIEKASRPSPPPESAAAPAAPAVPAKDMSPIASPGGAQGQQQPPASTEASAASLNASSTQAKPIPGLGSLRSGKSGASFGPFSKPLPGIGGAPLPPIGAGGASSGPAPSFEELKAKMAKDSGAAPAPAAAPAAADKNASQEEMIKQRQEYFRKQREQLLAKKKQERQTELSDFKTQNGADPAAVQPSPSKSGVDSAHQDITRELARRFRSDIAREATH